MPNHALDALRRAVTGRIESGDAVAIVEIPAPHVICEHDNGTEQVDGVEVCEMCGETVEDYTLACEALWAANPHRFEGEL